MQSFLLKRSCPNCAGPVEIINASSSVKCPFCGSVLVVKDHALLLKAAKEELSSKTLAEKYQNMVASDNKAKAEKEEVENKKKKFLELGLDISDSDIPLPLSNEALALLEEAIPLIEKDKWKISKTRYQKSDLAASSDCIRGIVDAYAYKKAIYLKRQGIFPKRCHHPIPFKLKYPDGSIRIQYYYAPDYYIVEKPFLGFLWETEINRAKEKMLDQIHQSIDSLKPYFYGSQEYVIIDGGFKYDCWDKMNFVLFRDGYIFYEDQDRDNKYYLFFSDLEKVEESLLRQVMHINQGKD